MHNDNDGAVPWYQGIEYFEFIGSVSVGIDIQREYLKQLNQYNLVAVELEYLLK